MNIERIHCVIPSRLTVGEPFNARVRVLGEVRDVPCEGQWNTTKPQQHGPFNLNVQRGIKYRDNCLPDWSGTLRVLSDEDLDGPESVAFDGQNQGVFPSDTRPIADFGPFTWTRPGIHFLRLVEPESGAEAWSNPVNVTETPPEMRLYWGDPHWQTFFSDGVRCPEELYAFARDEAFLDFGAITDHVEALTDRQWEYFVSVTNDYNQPGRFATLVGQEWTKHNPGHRNIYYRKNSGPVLRSTDPRYDSLDKLWNALAQHDAIAIPHHTANRIMGVDWDAGWNPEFESTPYGEAAKCPSTKAIHDRFSTAGERSTEDTCRTHSIAAIASDSSEEETSTTDAPVTRSDTSCPDGAPIHPDSPPSGPRN
jgi:hypothetical protein